MLIECASSCDTEIVIPRRRHQAASLDRCPLNPLDPFSCSWHGGRPSRPIFLFLAWWPRQYIGRGTSIWIDCKRVAFDVGIIFLCTFEVLVPSECHFWVHLWCCKTDWRVHGAPRKPQGANARYRLTYFDILLVACFVKKYSWNARVF